MCLEEDGTIIEDDEYLQTLDDHTTLIILRATDRYVNAWDIPGRY